MPTSPADFKSANALSDKLRSQISGDVRFDTSSRALYATDGSNYRQIPIGVVLPRNIDDVEATVALCREFDAPILCRGAGTSLAGQCCNVAVVLDFSRYMNQILEIDPTRRMARVQPGVILDTLRAAAEKHHLTFGPDPASHNRCTIGGMIGNNSCGVHSVMAGKTDDNIQTLEVLTYDGARLRVGRILSKLLTPARPCWDSRLRPSRRPRFIGPQRLCWQRIKPCFRPRHPNPHVSKKTLRTIRHAGTPALPSNPPPRLRLQPESTPPGKRLPHSPRPGRLRGHLRHHPRSHCPPGRKPAPARPSGHRLPRHLPVRRRCSRNPATQAHRPRRLRRYPGRLYAQGRH